MLSHTLNKFKGSFSFSSISFIGCGKMGNAILSGLLNSGKLTVNDVSITEKSDTIIERLETTYGIKNESPK